MTTARRQTAPRVKRVLAPTDFSPGAESALQWGMSLSAAFGAELAILNVLDLSLASVAGLPTEFAAMPAAAELIGRLRAETKTEMAKTAARYPRATTLVREGIPRPAPGGCRPGPEGARTAPPRPTPAVPALSCSRIPPATRSR